MSFSVSPGIGKAMKTAVECRLNIGSFSGIEGKIFDAVKSLLTLLKEWDEHHVAGKQALASVLKLKDSLGWKLDKLPAGLKLDALMDACNNLADVVNGMVEVVNNLQTLTEQIVLLAKLEEYGVQRSKRPVFPSGTWDCTKFGAVFTKISHAFQGEIKVLTSIMEAAAQSPDKSTLTVYIARWNNPSCLSNEGLCDNLLTCTVRAWNIRKPLLFCPAMNTQMWSHPITASQVETLEKWGYQHIPCISKTLMCGDTGMGAMAETNTIVASVWKAVQNVIQQN